MKKIGFIAAFAAAALMSVACNNGQRADVDVEAPTAAEIDSVSYLVGVNMGSMVRYYDFGDLDFAQIKKGFMDYVEAEGQPGSPEFEAQLKISTNEINRIFNEYLSKRMKYKAACNKADGDKFLEANKQKDGIEVTESGLQYKIIEAGNDVRATAKDSVFVNYKGTLINGDEFDSHSGEPMAMVLDRVIPAWTEGLQLIGEGGKIILYVPSELGYGERGSYSIEPNSVLVFEVELAKVARVAAEPEKK